MSLNAFLHYRSTLLRQSIIYPYFLTGIALLGLLHETQAQVANDLASVFSTLRDTTSWKQVDTIPLAFPAHHPQGMVKIGPYFYMSSVEVHNREAGQGVGHLFKFDGDGKLLANVQLGTGAMYHPGGIDFDGHSIWVSVAEYRPYSRSVVYTVHPESLVVTEVFRFEDHLGGIVHDPGARTLHGISWGSRTMYEWPLGASNKPRSSESPVRRTNPSYYIDYQDCQYVGNHRMLCGGVRNYRNGATAFRLGGLDLIDLRSHQPLYQIPFPYWSPSGRPMTQNPFWLERTSTGLRGYFVPDDDRATMYIFEAK